MSDELGVLLSLRRCASALQAVDDAAGSAGSGAADGAAAGIVAAQGAYMKPFWVAKYEAEAGKNWDQFYKRHSCRGFGDRHYVDDEFPEMFEDGLLVEVGCGVGNTVLPMLKAHPRLRAVAFDFAPRAIEALRAHADFDSRRCNAVVCDVAHEPLPVLDCSADYVTCFFALSAVAPRDFPTVAQKLAQALKPGGRLLFRDYGRYDLAQLRFKKGRRLGENHYVRSEGTLSYFFTPDQLVSLFQTGAGLEVVDCGFNKRNQLNRATEEERKRVFVQAHFSKPIR